VKGDAADARVAMPLACEGTLFAPETNGTIITLFGVVNGAEVSVQLAGNRAGGA
jgi:hypothetical protein